MEVPEIFIYCDKILTKLSESPHSGFKPADLANELNIPIDKMNAVESYLNSHRLARITFTHWFSHPNGIAFISTTSLEKEWIKEHKEPQVTHVTNISGNTGAVFNHSSDISSNVSMALPMKNKSKAVSVPKSIKFIVWILGAIVTVGTLWLWLSGKF